VTGADKVTSPPEAVRGAGLPPLYLCRPGTTLTWHDADGLALFTLPLPLRLPRSPEFSLGLA
jgi:hypothetical protein